MTKITLFQESIPPYRIDIFNLLAKKVDLTVLYVNDFNEEKAVFKHKQVALKTFRRKYIGRDLNRAEKQSDVVILPYSMGEYWDVLLKLKKEKYAFWGIGVAASYTCRYDAPLKRDSFAYVAKKANACLFYSDYPIKKYKKMGFDTNKMFVANNTVAIPRIELTDERNSILFIGSLYKQKKIEELFYAYSTVADSGIALPKLIVIGDGEMRGWCQEFIKSHGLEDKILLEGQIFDEEKLQDYFKNAYACISPDQAGLSVLKSMGYGVPYITCKNAITGGEIFNITDKENGVLFNSFDELSTILIDVAQNGEKYICMGKSAYKYYWEKRTPEFMVDGFLKVVDYIMAKRSK